MHDINNLVLEKTLKKNIDDFEKIVLSYEKLIYNIAYRIMSNHEDARDISQEVFIKLYKNINKCKNIKSIKSWLCKITSNTCIDEIRKRKGKQLESIYKELNIGKKDDIVEIKSKDLSPEESIILKENNEKLQNYISKLPYNYKVLIILRDINGFSYNEICEMTGLSLGALKSRISRSRKALKEVILNK